MLPADTTPRRASWTGFPRALVDGGASSARPRKRLRAILLRGGKVSRCISVLVALVIQKYCENCIVVSSLRSIFFSILKKLQKMEERARRQERQGGHVIQGTAKGSITLCTNLADKTQENT
jgi:hypothetical protein